MRYDFAQTNNLLSITYLQPPITAGRAPLYYVGVALAVLAIIVGLALSTKASSSGGDSDSVGTGLSLALVSGLFTIYIFRRLSNHRQGYRLEIALEFDLDRQRLTIRREKAGRTETRGFDLASVRRLDGFRDAGGEGNESWGVGLLLSDGIYRTVGAVQSGSRPEFFKKMDETRQAIGVSGDNKGEKHVKAWRQPTMDSLFSS